MRLEGAFLQIINYTKGEVGQRAVGQGGLRIAQDLDQASVAVAGEAQGLKATIERFLAGVRAA